MTQNIVVIPHLSPRIIKILAPITTISVQDLTNQMKDWEDEPSNLSYPALVNTSGKESLGGGVSVGITAELQNAVVMFEARTESDASGTYTNGDSSSTILTDDNAIFTYILLPGDSVFNMITGAVATVLSIDSPTQITHEPLDDGTTNLWNYGDDYKIWNKIQCEVNGGNLVAVDTAGADISPFLPSAFTHVIRTSASSATLQEQEDIQFSAFGGGVWIDATSSNSGTTFPAGTQRQPVNNLADALTISATRGFRTLFIIGSFTFVSGDNISLKEIRGEDIAKTLLTVESGVITAGTEFFTSTVQGIMIAPSGFTECKMLNVTGNTIGIANTITVQSCSFAGTITLSSLLEGEIQILNCFSGLTGADAPVFDMNGAQTDVLVRNYSGGMEIQNVTNSYSDISIDINSGQVIVDSSNTGGTIIIRGIANLIDNSNGTIVDTSGLVFADEIQLSAFNEKVSIDINNGVSGTAFPVGTRANPVNNITDALIIANARGLQTLFIIGDIILDTGDSIADFTLEGQNTNQTTITVNSGAVTDRVEYTNCTLTGILDGGSIIRQGVISDIQFFNGILLDSMINPGTITLGGNVEAHIINCFSGVPGVSTPIIDMGGSGQSLGLRGYNGGITLANKTGPDSASLDINSGQIVINSTVTDGTIIIRGISTLTDNSTGTANINTTGLIFADQTQLTSFNEKVTCDAIFGTPGTGFPQGTAQFPVNNLDDTLAIANARGITKISVVGDLTINYNDDVSGFIIEGQTISSSKITLESGCITEITTFTNCTLVGEAGGTIEAVDCELGESDEDLTNIGTSLSTIFKNSIIHDLSFSSTTTGEFLLLDCKSGEPADVHPGHPTINHNNSSARIGIRNYTGSMMFINMSDPYIIHSVDVISGEIEMRDSCTEGSMVVRGTCIIEDESGPNFIVNVDGVAAVGLSALRYEGGVHIDETNGVAGFLYPLGTPKNPVNNISDAKIIADREGITTYIIEGLATLDQDHEEWTFRGRNSPSDDIVDIYGFDVTDCRFEDIKIQGSLGGSGFVVNDCILDNVTNFSGTINGGTISDNIGIIPSIGQPTLLYGTTAGGATGIVNIDTGGGSAVVAGVNLTGKWVIDNMSPGPPFPPTIVSLEFSSGEVTLNASNTGGSAEFGGLANLTDNSTGVTVVSTNLLQPSATGGGAEAWDELIVNHQTANTFGKKLTDILKLKRIQP